MAYSRLVVLYVATLLKIWTDNFFPGSTRYIRVCLFLTWDLSSREVEPSLSYSSEDLGQEKGLSWIAAIR
jgi:hypothetical protein